jgi:hypothetical protein
MNTLSNGNEQTRIELKLHESRYEFLFSKIEFNAYVEVNEDMTEYVEIKKSTVVREDENNTIETTSTTEQLVVLTPTEIPRDLWTNKVEFLLSVIGYVVDLGKTKNE